jgi:hypothetical protein
MPDNDQMLEQMVLEAINICNIGRKFTTFELCKAFWDMYHATLFSSGDTLYTWQFDVVRVCQTLCDKNFLVAPSSSTGGAWIICA